MPRLRALIVADAVAMRRFFSEELAAEGSIEVAGTAANGKIAVAKVASLKPDVVIVSLEMAEDGAREAVQALRLAHLRLIIVVFSSTGKLSLATLRTLTASGASACVAASRSDSAEAATAFREELLPKIKALCIPRPERAERIDIVAIGISTGGPNALPVLLAALPGDFPVPIVIVQHMPPVFTLKLAERLNAKCPISVTEARAGETLRPGHVFLAPGDHHLILTPSARGATVELHQGPPENSCRPSVDPLFRSVAAIYGPHALGVVMTGMGRDGLQGCETLRAAGAQILAQDEATSVVWGMPGSVVRAGLADAVLPLEQMAADILSRVRTGRHSRSLASAYDRH